MKRVGIIGSTGRVGRLLVDALGGGRGDLVLGAVHVYGSEQIAVPSGVTVAETMHEALDASDVMIDFSAPAATEALLEAALHKPAPLVIATTGLTPHQHNLMAAAAEQMPILYATNMSAGIALLKQLVEQVAATLHDFDIEIVEMHHRHKVDAPSGTALTLAEYAAKGRGWDLDAVRISGREGHVGARKKDEIAVMALRGGDIVGRHSVGFYADGEYLELGHTATSRETFSNGAIRAAAWLLHQPAGLYDIRDCLGI